MTALKWTLLALAGLAILAGGGLAAAILFGTAAAPVAMASVSASMASVDYSDMPKPRQFQARDGAMLPQRFYPHECDRVAVLIRGSSGESSGMHAVARAIAGAGSRCMCPICAAMVTTAGLATSTTPAS